jgi:hypothetical protein
VLLARPQTMSNERRSGWLLRDGSRWFAKTLAGGMLWALGSSVAGGIALQFSTGLPLRLLGYIPLPVWTAFGALLFAVPSTLLIVHNRAARRHFVNRRFQPANHYDTWAAEVTMHEVRWRVHTPLHSSVMLSRPLSLQEIAAIQVELPPRCDQNRCGAELDESRRGLLAKRYVWRCVLHGEQTTSVRPWGELADEVRRVMRAKLESDPPLLSPERSW